MVLCQLGFLVLAEAAAAGHITCGGQAVTLHQNNPDGNNVILGTSERDVIHGEGGDDYVEANDGGDIVCGGLGQDDLIGQNGNDEMHGNAGGDDLLGEIGGDDLFGNEDSDVLFGQAGDDKLHGQANNDDLYDGKGLDFVDGGAHTGNPPGDTWLKCDDNIIDNHTNIETQFGPFESYCG